MQTPMCIAPSSGFGLRGSQLSGRRCEREVGVHGEPSALAPREDDREPPRPRECRAVGTHAPRVPRRRDPGLVALDGAARLVDPDREVANVRPDAGPLALPDPVPALDKIGDRAEGDRVGIAPPASALEVTAPY